VDWERRGSEGTLKCGGSSRSGVVGEWKVAPLRRDMLVLTVGWPDAFDEVGVRAGEVVFVVRRGWRNDMLEWPGMC
jgi:hypothetical protein